MKNLDLRNRIIEYSLKLNSTNLSPLRSGNISLRAKEDDKEGYLITPSGKKYETLKSEDIVFMSMDDEEKKNDSAEIQKIFKVSNAGKIAGSKVINGEIKSKSKARIIRDGVVVYSGEILSIFREKNQVKEVGTGLECGISVKDFIDFKEKDVIESYLSEEIRRSI